MDIKKKRKYRLIVIIIIVLGIVSYGIYNGYRSFREDSRNPISVSNSIPTNYINLFNNSAKEKLKALITTGFKLRNPISFINYDQYFDLEITQINCKPSFDIEKDVIESHEGPSATMAESYLPNNISNITTNYNPESNIIASKIYLSLIGDSTKTIVKNDSIACYYLISKNVTVQYSVNGVKEIFIEKKYFYNSNQPIEIMFLKKDDKLYYIFLTSKSEDLKLPSNMLFNLVH